MAIKNLWFYLWALAMLIVTCYSAAFMKLLKTFSFDYADQMFPRWSYKTDGAAVVSRSFIKLIPPVVNRAGEVLLRKKLRSQSFQIDVTFTIKATNNNNPFGFALWYINSEKTYKRQ